MATLPTDTGNPTPFQPDTAIWAGRILSGLAILALTMDAAGKLVVPELMIASSPPLGLPTDPAFHRLLGAILVICTALYAWPRTSVLGAILLTGYLGGAVSAHLRVGSPIVSFTLVGVYIGVVVWVGLWLRDPRVRALFV
jgi:DoxX-like family